MLSPSPSSAWHHQSLLPGGNEDDLPGRKGNQAIHLEDEYPFIGDRHDTITPLPLTTEVRLGRCSDQEILP